MEIRAKTTTAGHGKEEAIAKEKEEQGGTIIAQGKRDKTHKRHHEFRKMGLHWVFVEVFVRMGL